MRPNTKASTRPATESSRTYLLSILSPTVASSRVGEAPCNRESHFTAMQLSRNVDVSIHHKQLGTPELKTYHTWFCHVFHDDMLPGTQASSVVWMTRERATFVLRAHSPQAFHDDRRVGRHEGRLNCRHGA